MNKVEADFKLVAAFVPDATIIQQWCLHGGEVLQAVLVFGFILAPLTGNIEGLSKDEMGKDNLEI